MEKILLHILIQICQLIKQPCEMNIIFWLSFFHRKKNLALEHTRFNSGVTWILNSVLSTS